MKICPSRICPLPNLPPPEFAVKTELPDSRSRVRAVLGALFLTLALTACGGGGGGSINTAPSGTAQTQPDTAQTQSVRVGDRYTASGNIVRRGTSTPGTLNGVEGTFTCASQGCSISGSRDTNTGVTTVSAIDGVTFTPGPASQGGMMQPTETRTGFTNLDATNARYAATAASRAAAAVARPSVGSSITQSSNVNDDGITVDRVSVTATHGAGRNSYSVHNGSEWSISTRDGNPVSIPDVPAPFKGSELYKRTNGGTLYVDVYSDIEAPTTQQTDGGSGGTPDTDYLAGGVWLFIPDSATSVDDVVLGAFADGSAPFRQSNLMALTGTARYGGKAAGIASGSGIDYFEADVSLQANFGGASDLGTIRGQMDDFLVDGSPEDGALDLGAANIGSSNNGFFRGSITSSNTDTGKWNGRWGGQFFGNGGADGKPGSVAGTFAASTGELAIVGAFGAHKQP